MQKIYDANNGIEANLLKNILLREGVEAHISGEYLQGGVGELPAIGLISIMVEDGYVSKAKKIISDWQQGKYEI